MSFTQKDLIVAYREEGLSYREIADKTGATEQFCRTVCSRANRKQKDNIPVTGMCRYCGKQLTHTDGAKKKQFCSDECRSAFHNREKMRKSFIRVCEHCGQEFVSFGYPKKRYCSRECRTKAERRGREDHL
ncbi:MAG: sigma-70 family RNA polymerase sigma factor [Clostridia bacterium]|nr:sigma-70 family RNA polymerase sigma factor [Clostridia bacterium]